MAGDEQPALLSPAQVAAFFGVTAATVTRWAKAGRLSTVRTLGGHRRFLKTEVDQLAAVEARDDDG